MRAKSSIAKSIAFCEEKRLDYVSASPYRVPIARLASAQATLSRSGAVVELPRKETGLELDCIRGLNL